MNNISFDYLVFGENGQDGFFTTRFLLKNNFSVVAVARSKFYLLNNLKKKYKKKLKLIKITDYTAKNYKHIFKNKKIKNIFFLLVLVKYQKINMKENYAIQLILKYLIIF